MRPSLTEYVESFNGHVPVILHGARSRTVITLLGLIFSWEPRHTVLDYHHRAAMGAVQPRHEDEVKLFTAVTEAHRAVAGGTENFFAEHRVTYFF
jgi:hypothetical protein